MIDVSITSDSPDTRPALPADMVSTLAPEVTLTTAVARRRLDAAANRAERYLERPLWRASYTERLVGPGSDKLMLSRYPVQDLPVVTVIDSGEVVDATTYSQTGTLRHALYRKSMWTRTSLVADPLTQDQVSPPRRLYYSVAYTAGWLMPGQVSTWAASTAYPAEVGSASYDDPATGSPYAVGSWVRSNDRRVALRFECTSAGTSGSTEPVAFLAASAGDEITDNTATWTARVADELPEDLSEVVLQMALLLERKRNADPSLKSFSKAGASVTLREHSPWEDFYAALRPYR